jgi:GTP:adenosylcobinamide-phosphate guanylyltransferase
VVIESIKKPVILVCSDITLSASQIIVIYAARFALEITIRDVKQHSEFTDYQGSTTIAIARFVQLCCTAFSIWKMMLLPENASSWLDKLKSTPIKESAFRLHVQGVD